MPEPHVAAPRSRSARGVKSLLLPPSRRLSRTRRLCLQRTVQPLQPSILLWMTGFDALRYHAQLDRSYRQRRQAPQANTGKGRPFVPPDGPWKSELPKGVFQDPAHLRSVGVRQPIAGQQAPRDGVLHGDRVDPKGAKLKKSAPVRV